MTRYNYSHFEPHIIQPTEFPMATKQKTPLSISSE